MTLPAKPRQKKAGRTAALGRSYKGYGADTPLRVF